MVEPGLVKNRRYTVLTQLFLRISNWALIVWFSEGLGAKILF